MCIRDSLKAVVTDRQQRGSIFAPIHWSDETSSSARVGALVAPFTDPLSGQPESKATPAAIAPHGFAQRGFVLSRTPLSLPAGAWWARVAVTGGYGYLLAADEPIEDWQSWLRNASGSNDIADYEDRSRHVYRAAAYRGDIPQVCLFVGPAGEAIAWDAVKTTFAATALDEDDRRALLSGRSRDGLSNAGPIVCACFGVGRGTICDAIASGGARSVAEIGASLKAGTNCGSCIPELKRLIAQTPVSVEAPAPAERTDLVGA